MLLVFGRHRVFQRQSLLKAKPNRDALGESSNESQPGLSLNRNGPSTRTAILTTAQNELGFQSSASVRILTTVPAELTRAIQFAKTEAGHGAR
jgi:hypothetical protein